MFVLFHLKIIILINNKFSNREFWILRHKIYIVEHLVADIDKCKIKMKQHSKQAALYLDNFVDLFRFFDKCHILCNYRYSHCSKENNLWKEMSIPRLFHLLRYLQDHRYKDSFLKINKLSQVISDCFMSLCVYLQKQIQKIY